MRFVFCIIFIFVSHSVFCQQPRLVLPIGHTVNTATYSKDGRYIVSTGFLSNCKVWEVISGRLLITISTPNVEFAKFGNTIDTIIVYKNDSTTSYINSQSGVEYYRDSSKAPPFIESFKVSKNSSYYLRESEDGEDNILVIKKNNDSVISKLIGHKDIIHTAFFNPSGTKIVTTSYDGTAKVWNTGSGKMEFELYKNNFPFEIPVFGSPQYYNFFSHYAEFSPNGKSILTCSNGDIEIYSSKDGKLMQVIQGEFQDNSNMAFWNDNNFITTYGNLIRIWNLNSGTPKEEIKTYPSRINCIAIDRKRNTIAIGQKGGTVALVNLNTKKQGRPIIAHSYNNVNSICFSKNGKSIISASDDNSISISGIIKNIKQRKIKGIFSDVPHDGFFANDDRFLKVASSNTGKYIAALSNDGVLRIYSEKDLYKITSTLNSVLGVSAFQFNETDDEIFFIDGTDNGLLAEFGYLRKWNFKGMRNNSIMKISDSIISESFYFDSTNTHIYIAKPNGIYKVRLDSNENRILVKFPNKITSTLNFAIDQHEKHLLLSYNGLIECIDIKKQSSVYKLFSFSNSSYITLIENNFYRSDNSFLSKTHYVLNDFRAISFDQLDIKYNRPDKVLEYIGSTDTALIKAYRQAYYKRIEKLGVDTSYFNDDYTVPEADFENRDIIESDQTKANLHLFLNASDKYIQLDRYNVWVNEVPLYGQKGKSCRDKNTKELKSLPVEVELAPGRNKIEFSVFNTNGIESYRQPLFVNYNPSVPLPPEKVYFIGIGINRFASQTNSLNWCVKDIRDLTRILKQKIGKKFVVLDTLFDEHVTLQNIQQMKEKLLKTGINDKVVIAYSGHGLLSKKYDYYLSGFDVDFKSPENGGIPYEALEGLLDSIPARKKLLLLDACNSGEVDNSKGAITAGGRSTKGIGDSVEVVGVDKTKLGLDNSFELMRELFVNVNKGTGATVIAAAQGYQSALEQNKLGHGVFTYSILDALKTKSTMKVSELKKWVSENVVKLTDGKQQPTTRIEPIDVDWSVW